LAVKAALATPLELVAATIVLLLLPNVPPAPVEGAVKVTLTPETGLLNESFTVTASALANTAFTSADCGVVPALAVMELAAPAALVRLKFTAVKPAADADTL
jgi:hypothetical protein